MELRQLRTFIKAAETLNFSEAAKSLNMTQSAFSQNIKQLEDELHVQLFFRNSHEVAISEAGMELLPYARKTVQQSENCVNRMNDLNNLQCGTLNIGVTHSFSQIMAETVIKFIHDYPHIKLNVVYKTMDELMGLLSKRELDFVLSYKGTQKYPQIESHILFEDKLSVIVKSTHPLAEKDKISLPDIDKYSLVLPAKGLQARNALERILNENKIDIEAHIESNQVSSLLRLVQSSHMVTILSETSVNMYPDLKAIPFSYPHCEMQGSFHILKDSYRKESVKEFIRILNETDMICRLRTNWI